MTSATMPYRLLVRCPAGWKLLALLLLSTALILIREPIGLLTGAAIALVLWLSLGTDQTASALMPQARVSSLLWFALMLCALAGVTAWQAGWAEALGVLGRLLAMVLFAAVVMRTTSLSAMMSVVERSLAPLGRWGWMRPARVALAFGMMLRFLPVLREQWEEIQQAQAARCVKVSFHALLVPMLVRTLRRAEEIAQALDARGMSD